MDKEPIDIEQLLAAERAAEEGRRPQPRRTRRGFSSWRHSYAYRHHALRDAF